MLYAFRASKARINKCRLFYFNSPHFCVRLQYLVAPTKRMRASLTFTSAKRIVERIYSGASPIEPPRAPAPDTSRIGSPCL